MNEDTRRRIDALADLRDFWWNSYTSRRQYEWKVALTIWAAVAALVAVTIKDGGALAQRASLGGQIGIAVALWGFYAFFVLCVADANRRDQKNAWDLADQIAELAHAQFSVPAEVHRRTWSTRNRLRRDWTTTFHLFVSALLFGAALAILWL